MNGLTVLREEPPAGLLQRLEAGSRAHRFTSRSEVAILAAAVLVGIALGGVGPYWVRIAELVLIYALASQALDLVSGYAGQFSLGHSGLFAIGAYTSAIAYTRTDLPLLVCLGIAIVLASAAGVLLAGPSLVIGGLYLALVTLAFAFIVANIANDAQSLTNGPTGIGPLQPHVVRGGFDRMLGKDYLLVVVLVFAVCWLLLRRVVGSRWGRALVGIRESPSLAAAVGVRVRSTKIAAFVVSAGLTGLAGALYAHLGYISPHDLTWQLSVSFLVVIFLGGIGTLTGAILGASLLIIVPERITASGDLRLVMYGAVLVFVMVAAPGGLLGVAGDALRRLRSRLMPPASAREAETPHARPAFAAALPPAPLAPLASPGALEAVDVVKSYAGLRALRGASLRVEPGTLVGLIGPNGSGKTTFLNCVGGQVRADAGSIRLGGGSLVGLSPTARAERGLFRTFQHGALCSSLSCRENVMLGAHMGGRFGFVRALGTVHARAREEGELRRAADRMLEYLDIPPEYAARTPGEVPYGLRRLVEIGVALMSRPAILLLDEPAAGLVDEEIVRLEAVLRDLLDAGIGVLLVEHHLQLVMNLAEQVVVLDGGELIAVGSPRAVVADAAVQKAYLGHGWASDVPGPAGEPV